MYRCLSDKIAETLRRELAEGRYGPGRAFPSVDALRQRFGVGEYAVRHALQRLREEGLVIHRQRTGTVPTAKASYPFKGRVAFVCTGQAGDFFRNTLAIRLAQRFREAGWDFISVFLPISEKAESDSSALRMIAANGLAFAIFLGFETKVSEIFDEFAIPYIVLNRFARDFPNARAVIREDFRACVAELIGALRARNAKTLHEFDIERVMDRGFRRQLADAGIALSSTRYGMKPLPTLTLADVRRCGHLMVAKFFADRQHRENPPDAILFDDDYLAFGGLVALYEAGLRVPEDIGVVFYSNKDNEPVLGVEPTRIENDPVSCGDAVASYVIKLLEGRRAAPPRISWRFIRGASL